MEKRPCSGIARVTPSSHVGSSTHGTSTAGEAAGWSRAICLHSHKLTMFQKELIDFKRPVHIKTRRRLKHPEM